MQVLSCLLAAVVLSADDDDGPPVDTRTSTQQLGDSLFVGAHCTRVEFYSSFVGQTIEKNALSTRVLISSMHDTSEKQLADQPVLMWLKNQNEKGFTVCAREANMQKRVEGTQSLDAQTILSCPYHAFAGDFNLGNIAGGSYRLNIPGHEYTSSGHRHVSNVFCQQVEFGHTFAKEPTVVGSPLFGSKPFQDMGLTWWFEDVRKTDFTVCIQANARTNLWGPKEANGLFQFNWMAVLPQLGGVSGEYKQAGTAYSPLWEKNAVPNEWQSCQMVEYQEQNLLGTRPVVIVSATFRRKVALTDALADGVHKTQLVFRSQKSTNYDNNPRPVHSPVVTWIKELNDRGFVVCSVTKHFEGSVEALAWDYVVF
jgi:hypothetical protein